MPYTTESFIKQMLHSAETYEKKANKLWAQAKNGGGNEDYKYAQARANYEKAKNCRQRAEKAKSGK